MAMAAMGMAIITTIQAAIITAATATTTAAAMDCSECAIHAMMCHNEEDWDWHEDKNEDDNGFTNSSPEISFTLKDHEFLFADNNF
jgi:hypothetical protein